MGALIDVILPVFLVIGVGYMAAARDVISSAHVDGLMRFSMKFAIPCLLFQAMANLDLDAGFDLRLLGSFYTGAFTCFLLGMFGARFFFDRSWQDAIAIGFCCLYSNSLLLGLPIAQRAYGIESLTPNYAIISIHAPFCIVTGVTAMEIAKGGPGSPIGKAGRILKEIFSNVLVIGLGLGFLVNISGLSMPTALDDGIDLIARAGLPAALFGLGGVLTRYRPEGDMRAISFVLGISLILHPTIVWFMGHFLNLSQEALRAGVLTAAMAPGINAFVFSDLYGAAKRVAASSILAGTALTVLTAWGWLHILG